jgi:hypothetical protein
MATLWMATRRALALADRRSIAPDQRRARRGADHDRIATAPSLTEDAGGAQFRVANRGAVRQ